MIVAISELVAKLAECSTLITAMIVQLVLWSLILLFIKYVLAVWLRGEPVLIGELHSTVRSRVPEIKMNKVHNPFTLKLTENPLTSFREIGCKVSCRVGYKLISYWGFDVQVLHMLLRQSWVTIIAEMREGTMPRGYFLCPGPHYSCKEHSQKVIRFKIPPERLDFGVFPRKYYPLVIFLLTESDEGAQIDDTLALISIIHIEEQECTLPTSILAQYMKQYSGLHFCLKLLYVVTGFNDGEMREEEELLCVVCQFFPLSRALLPCRHACICALCFSRINTCPMCRGQISSYFCVRNENYILRENKGIGRSAVDELAHWMFRNLRM